jgi:hypothetical protein
MGIYMQGVLFQSFLDKRRKWQNTFVLWIIEQMKRISVTKVMDYTYHRERITRNGLLIRGNK